MYLFVCTFMLSAEYIDHGCPVQKLIDLFRCENLAE